MAPLAKCPEGSLVMTRILRMNSRGDQVKVLARLIRSSEAYPLSLQVTLISSTRLNLPSDGIRNNARSSRWKRRETI
jgi:hypothetical protein